MIIGYLRVSTGKQNPENQKDEIRRYLEEKNSGVDQWVVETVSGKVPFKKRKLGRVIRKMQKGAYLIVTEISRLSRSLVELMEIMGACVEKGISLYTTKEHYSFDNTINSKVLCFAFGLVAEIERNLISMRTREALALKKMEGVRLGRKPGSDVKMRIVRENEAKILKMLNTGMTVSAMCRRIGISRNTWYRYKATAGGEHPH